MNENNNDKALTTVKDKEKKSLKKVTGVDENFENEFDIKKVLNTVSKLQYTESELKILHDPFDDDDLDIMPTGVVYAPWVSFVRRLRSAFKGAYMLLPHGMPKIEGNLVMWPHYLLIKGYLVSYSVGECNYYPNNSQMSYGDAIEGAKSNARMRCCKDVGIGLELWDRKFTDKWKEKNAYESDKLDKHGNKIWKRNVGSKKPLYIKVIRYLFELLDINEKVFLKQKGKVAIELCKEDELNVFKNELEKKIKEKFYPKSEMKEASKTKPKNDLIIMINSVTKKRKKNMAWLTTQLMTFNITDMNKASIEDLKTVLKNISKGIKKDKPENKKPESTLEDLLNQAEKLAKEKGINSKSFDELTKNVCGDKVTKINMNKVIQHLKKIEVGK